MLLSAEPQSALLVGHLTPMHMGVDAALHVTALAGIVLSAFAVVCQLTSSLVFVALYLLHLTLFQ